MMTEDDVIKLLNVGHYNFVRMDEKFSRYDAFDADNGIMLEIKCRRKHYDDTIIEKPKYDWNKKYAKDNGFEFMYAVTMPTEGGDILYLFDPIAMEEHEDYDFGWETRKLPAQTDFNWKEWIDKEVGYLHINDAMITLEKKTSH